MDRGNWVRCSVLVLGSESCASLWSADLPAGRAQGCLCRSSSADRCPEEGAAQVLLVRDTPFISRCVCCWGTQHFFSFLRWWVCVDVPLLCVCVCWGYGSSVPLGSSCRRVCFHPPGLGTLQAVTEAVTAPQWRQLAAKRLPARCCLFTPPLCRLLFVLKRLDGRASDKNRCVHVKKHWYHKHPQTPNLHVPYLNMSAFPFFKIKGLRCSRLKNRPVYT